VGRDVERLAPGKGPGAVVVREHHRVPARSSVRRPLDRLVGGDQPQVVPREVHLGYGKDGGRLRSSPGQPAVLALEPGLVVPRREVVRGIEPAVRRPAHPVDRAGLISVEVLGRVRQGLPEVVGVEEISAGGGDEHATSRQARDVLEPERPLEVEHVPGGAAVGGLEELRPLAAIDDQPVLRIQDQRRPAIERRGEQVDMGPGGAPVERLPVPEVGGDESAMRFGEVDVPESEEIQVDRLRPAFPPVRGVVRDIAPDDPTAQIRGPVLGVDRADAGAHRAPGETSVRGADRHAFVPRRVEPSRGGEVEAAEGAGRWVRHLGPGRPLVGRAEEAGG